jgi:prepilin-type N-terminal cleavage/methylation domain-containing protein
LRLGAGEGGRNSAARKRRGFTLVEVIVVLVILAILAAIAIPALTGYISKAEDKQYEQKAHDHVMAAHAVVSEYYALDKLNPPNGQGFLTDGRTGYISVKLFALDDLVLGTDVEIIRGDVNKLIAAGYSSNYMYWSYYWMVDFIGPETAGTTVFNADAFAYYELPEGATNSTDPGKPMILVTYKIQPLSGYPTDRFSFEAFAETNYIYDASAGFNVYHLTTS